jgi:hypothetical protein
MEARKGTGARKRKRKRTGARARKRKGARNGRIADAKVQLRFLIIANKILDNSSAPVIIA